MGYEGHLVMVADPDERATRVRDAVSRLGETADLLEQNGLSAQIVSGGGTGTYDITGTCAPITEVQAGSYVFMDTTYLKVRPEFAPSLTVLATVVSRPTPDRLVTDAGRKTISNDFGLPQPLEVPGASVRSLSEEHGIIELAAPAEVDLKPGDKISFIPSHCCTTVNLYNDFYIIQGGKLVDIWPIAARGRSQ
jgi:D-serine deaminase-like pyridoxal phosphate-dependent protein